MPGLSPEQIALLLKEEASQPTRTRGKKADPTLERTVQSWFRLQHHLCYKDCEHRTDPNNKSEGEACWNPNCMDKVRNKDTDRATQAVALVKGEYICRYCFIGGYLS